jgi:hypothetical protein
VHGRNLYAGYGHYLVSKKALRTWLPGTAANLEDRRRKTEPLLRMWLSFCLLLVVSHPLKRLDSHKARRRRASAIP